MSDNTIVTDAAELPYFTVEPAQDDVLSAEESAELDTQLRYWYDDHWMGPEYKKYYLVDSDNDSDYY